MQTLSRLVCCAVGLAVSSMAIAQQAPYPSKPIRFIIPFPAGGTTDVAARMIGQKLTESWGQPVLVEARPGAGGSIATELVSKAAPDGHTLLASTIAFAIIPSLRAKLGYDPVKDFTPITQLSALPLIIVVHPSLPVKNVKELVALARAKPGSITFASSGSGTSPHLAGEMLKAVAKIDLVHVPYKGSAMGANALLGGHVMMNIGLLPAVLPQMQAKRVRAIAATSAKRIPSLPDLPTVAESGYPDYEISSWQGVWAPAGISQDVLAKLHREMVRIVKLPDVNERITSEGAVPVASSPAEFSAFVRREIAKWAKVVKESGARED